MSFPSATDTFDHLLTPIPEIGDKVTPNSQKSTVDKVGDTLTGAGDKIGRDAVPDSQKSTTQSMTDKASRQKDSAKDESVLDKAK